MLPNILSALEHSLTVYVSWAIYNMQNNKWHVSRKDYFKTACHFHLPQQFVSLIIDSWVCESWKNYHWGSWGRGEKGTDFAEDTQNNKRRMN